MNSTSTELIFDTLEERQYLKIKHVDAIRPFFMSIVSHSDHWMFIGSNGGLSAGRKHSEMALFPYYTDDKIIEGADHTGSKTLIRLTQDGLLKIWEPFTEKDELKFKVTRNLYKSINGNSVLFEEINHDLNLQFQYSWDFSDKFGFVRSSKIQNLGNEEIQCEVLDGIQNILPFGVGSDLQRASSNLVDAYKRSELAVDSRLAIFALSAIIVDKAEPSEALKSNIVWSSGLNGAEILLSASQLKAFRKGATLQGESDVKGERGAYLLYGSLQLPVSGEEQWSIVGDVNKNHAQIVALLDELQTDPSIFQQVRADVADGDLALSALIGAADGLQLSADELMDCRHRSNVLFNIMRGGIFDNHYCISKSDLISYLYNANRELILIHHDLLDHLPKTLTYQDLIVKASETADPDLKRLLIEYLPLKFSRRHGDPSRPWNKFTINLKDELTGQPILDYEGNWRDIFQNWEALAWSYPFFIEGMMLKFLNASTFDGYNPYRVTKGGFDWEVIEPDDPWSYIGYWGDHQVIYLQKFLEEMEQFLPGRLHRYLEEDLFVYAAVPYKIKSFQEIVQNPKDTIVFDHEWDHAIRNRRDEFGADGALLLDTEQMIYKVNLLEKLLAMVLSKLSNFIPDGGIWMNTQRPEWNDANNALVGNGVSMVTLYYLRRTLTFMRNLVAESESDNFKISNELVEFYHSVRETFEHYSGAIDKDISAELRKSIVDRLGIAGSDYRNQIYKTGFWGKKRSVSQQGILRFIDNAVLFIDYSIASNKRADGLYHAYNLMFYQAEGVDIAYLDEMLEGQVAVLSSGKLNPNEALSVLDGLKHSTLFREDQYSYLLYPNKALPGFLAKNNIPKELIQNCPLAMRLTDDGDTSVIHKDIKGDFHFNGNFRNVNDLRNAIEALPSQYHDQIELDKNKLEAMFESVFNHKAFTGRSGTFYAYEGLGSIYWHMVSKLLLATQENCLRAVQEQSDASTIGRLLEHYYEIQAGIGVHKSPELYGAFPTDPYSHTPAHKGAQQPGMTGQVKEDILSHWGELGVQVVKGTLRFGPSLLRHSDFSRVHKKILLTSVDGTSSWYDIQQDELLFTLCQVPIIYRVGDRPGMIIKLKEGGELTTSSNEMSATWSQSIFAREGKIDHVVVHIPANQLR